MTKVRGVLAVSCLLALPTAAGAWGECRYEAPRSASVDAAGATTLRVIAKSGGLKIRGEEGTRVEATGTACADSRGRLEEVLLKSDRSGGEVRLEVVTPDARGANASLDLDVRVPRGMAVVVDDGSGDVEVADVASLRLEDGSGGVEIRGVAGDLEIHDGSGEIEVERVGGSVVVEDGSGSIAIADVTGSVTIEDDGSGEIRIEGVGRDVRVRRDGSGSIRVRDVKGDFVVDRDGSGSIDHSGVQGRVRVPSR